MATVSQQLESILFISPRPLGVKKLAGLVGADVAAVEAALTELANHYQGRGVELKRIGSEVQLATSGECRAVVDEFVKEEFTGELTRPSLETLTIIAYRGPVGKPELELIRGVNCSLILRNLLMRGLIEEVSDAKLGTRYQVSFQFLRYLGVNTPSELPNYAALNSDENLQKLLQQSLAASAESPTDL